MSSTTSALFDDALAAKLLISKVKLHGFDRVSEAASNATATPVMHYPPAANLDPSSSSVSPGQQLGSLSCSVCVFASANQPRFDTIQEQRQHFKSDFHALNVKRKLAGKPAVDEAQFEVLLETESLGSLEGSESETDGEEDGDIGGGGGGGGAGGGAGSPFIQLFMPSQSKQPVTSFGMTSTPSSSTNYVFSIYKQVFSHQKKLQHESPESLLALVQARLSLFQRERSRITWTMIMVGSGHFAGAVFQCSTGKALFHKTFHRYTTRRKQGGAQSSNDSSGRFAKSAGAGLRRYNEQALQVRYYSPLSYSSFFPLLIISNLNICFSHSKRSRNYSQPGNLS